MRAVHILVSLSLAILSSIDSSSQFECLPDGTRIPGAPRDGASFPSIHIQHLSASTSPHVEPQSLPSFPPSVKLPQRSRSRSTPSSSREAPTRLPSSDGLGSELDQLPFIRLISSGYPDRQFELRRYTFPTDKRIKVLEEKHSYKLVPPQEQIVLSTHEGDVFAILTSENTLAGIYKLKPQTKHEHRAKINIESGEITSLTQNEIKEVPVGYLRPISHNFRVEHVNHGYGSIPTEEARRPVSSMSRSAISLTNVLGYRMDQLQFIRLRSIKNLQRQFGVRRYTFPVDKPIKIRADQRRFRLMPIEEQIILSTPSGEVFALFETSRIISGIYAYTPSIRSQGRVKINILSSKITFLSADEMSETPVGTGRPVSDNFIVDLVNYNHADH